MENNGLSKVTILCVVLVVYYGNLHILQQLEAGTMRHRHLLLQLLKSTTYRENPIEVDRWNRSTI